MDSEEEIQQPEPTKKPRGNKKGGKPMSEAQKSNLSKAVKALRERREQEWTEHLEKKKKEVKKITQDPSLPSVAAQAYEVISKAPAPEPAPKAAPPQYLTVADVETLLDSRLSNIFAQSRTEKQIEVHHIKRSKPKTKIVYVSESESDDEPKIVRRPKQRQEPAPPPAPLAPPMSKRDALLSFLTL